VTFHGDSSGGKARIRLFGDGQLSVGRHNPPGLTIGSLEGDGVVVLTYLSSYDLITLGIGSNNRSTTFAGVIQDRINQSGGSLSKVGTGTLTLTGSSTYTGGTTISSGVLRVSNQTGSGTGTGRVKVRGGTLGGKGTIAGAVTIAGRSGRGAFLAPSIGAANPATLTIQRVLTFEANGSYVYKLNSARLKGDMVVSNGLTIYSGAQFAGSDVGGTVFPPGTVLTAINNTSTAAISGTFSNLADGGAITIGDNTFQADYEGGDGNDLTLTVVQ
jgi:autotransporter-associated beta strand protein